MREYVESRIKSSITDIFNLNPEEIGFVVGKPKEKKWGDISSNVAFILAKRLRKSPFEIGGLIVDRLRNDRGFEKVDMEKGFLNFTLSKEFVAERFLQVLEKGENFFRSDLGKGTSVQVEFVSANPTGPLHLGHGRGAVVGDALCNILDFFGYSVTREYYVNDAGNQIYLLGKSIYARYMELLGVEYAFPKDGYKGEYIEDIARAILEEKGEFLLSLTEEEAIDFCIEYGLSSMLNDIKDDLELLGIKFDIWYSERSLYERGLVYEVLKKLEKGGLVYEREGALWFKSSAFGDDKDRVIRKSDGSYTYFASDIAYHYDKFVRGFKKVIDLWGADHHGYETRVRAALKALGIREDWLDIYFVQMVKLFRGKDEIKMSKRSGEFITLRELIDDIGKDAVRFMFLTKRSDTPLSIDIEIVKKKTSENPVFYVQYAYARTCGITREMEKRYGVDFQKIINGAHEILKWLDLSEEKSLMKKVIMFKDDLIECAIKKEPHIITYLLSEISAEFHRYYNRHRVVTDDINISMARFLLVQGVKTVISLGLKLIGVSRPERM